MTNLEFLQNLLIKKQNAFLLENDFDSANELFVIEYSISDDSKYVTTVHFYIETMAGDYRAILDMDVTLFDIDFDGDYRDFVDMIKLLDCQTLGHVFYQVKDAQTESVDWEKLVKKAHSKPMTRAYMHLFMNEYAGTTAITEGVKFIRYTFNEFGNGCYIRVGGAF